MQLKLLHKLSSKLQTLKLSQRAPFSSNLKTSIFVPMSSISLQDLLRIEKLLDKVKPDSGAKLLTNLVLELNKAQSNSWLQKYISSAVLWESRDSFFKDAKQNLSSEVKTNPECLDLSGVECPTNLAKAVLFLQKDSTPGQTSIILDSGSPIENVPRGLKQRGYSVSKRIKLSNLSWQISVSKP